MIFLSYLSIPIGIDPVETNEALVTRAAVITDGDQLAWLAAAFARAFCIVTVIKANK
jgi:hypothetical protein